MSDTYQHFANDYDWLFDDEGMRHGVAIQSPATARVLSELTPGSTVLDAACGTGIDAVALERRGFRVHASDGSPAMVEQAVARFRQEGAEVHGFVATWDQLPDSTRRRFDAVLCIGNSLVHATGPEAMVSALRGLRGVVRPGGQVVVDARNWEKLHEERQIVSVHNRPIIRGGRRCVVIYAWEIPNDFYAEHMAHVVLVFDNGDSFRPHEYTVPFTPFTRDDLTDRLRAAGLREIDSDFSPGADRYAIVCQPEPA